MDEILVFPLPGIEPCVEFRSCRDDLVNLDSMGKDGIYFVAKIIRVKVLGRGFEVRHIVDRVDLGIGPAGPCDSDFLPEEG